MKPRKDMHRTMDAVPLAYFITFHTYGTWIHGDDRGSVDRHHNLYGTPMLPPDPSRRFQSSDSVGGVP
jgi:hypothetical protein